MGLEQQCWTQKFSEGCTKSEDFLWISGVSYGCEGNHFQPRVVELLVVLRHPMFNLSVHVWVEVG